ncbi:hypothetical protein B0O80DRAFT_429867 [Mortierella sp. GBAus27b]|nr:hypothetical protein B0O80DRAFT_429867 [Mortierella sp. GBAus27b]
MYNPNILTLPFLGRPTSAQTEEHPSHRLSDFPVCSRSEVTVTNTFRTCTPRSLLPSQALDLANVYLENAGKATDSEIALVLCHDTEVSLSQAKKNADQSVIDGIAETYGGLGKQLEELRRDNEAQAIYKKAEKLG